MIVSPWDINPTDDLLKQLETCLGPYHPDMMDQWVIDDELDAEKTEEHVPPFPNTWSDDSKVQDPSLKLKPQVLGVWEIWESCME